MLAARRLGRRAPRALRHLSSSDLKFFAGVPEVTKDGVAIIRLDNKSQKMNTLSPALQDEAKQLWKELTAKHDVKAAVFISNKPDNFIAGADIGMLASKKKPEKKIRYEPCVCQATPCSTSSRVQACPSWPRSTARASAAASSGR